MKAIFFFLLRWSVIGAVLVAGLLGIAYGIAHNTLTELVSAALTAERSGTAPPPNIPLYKSTALYVAAQVFPLRQPGADLVREGRIFKDCEEICPDMVELPAGYFFLGSPLTEWERYTHVITRRPYRKQLPFWNREGPRRFVRVEAPVALSRFEITRAQWDAAQADPDWETASGQSPRTPAFEDDPAQNRPVTGITWTDAKAYAAWLSAKTGHRYRLPTDAEWEYAARAGTTTTRPWGNDAGQNMAACDGCGPDWAEQIVGPVGQFPPNGFGLYDMIGNGWEWVEDCFEPWHDEVQVDAAAFVYDDCEFVTFRGGSAEDPPWQNRSAMRVGPHPYNDGAGSTIRLLREMGPSN